MTEKLTAADLRTLEILASEGPQLNGDLGTKTGLAWNSVVFDRLERLGLTTGHPIRLTDKGRAAARHSPPPGDR
jgi:hypothetical protein